MPTFQQTIAVHVQLDVERNSAECRLRFESTPPESVPKKLGLSPLGPETPIDDMVTRLAANKHNGTPP